MSLEDEKYLMSNIKLNFCILQIRFKLNEHDFSTFYENCFRVYDKILPKVPAKANHGKTLMLIVNDAANMLVNDFKTFEQEKLNEGIPRDRMNYRLNYLDDKEIELYTKIIFGKYYGK